MKELKCPNCGKNFTVDEGDYAAILQQVHTAEFDMEVERRIKEIVNQVKVEEELKAAKHTAEELEKQKKEIEALKTQLMSEREKKQSLEGELKLANAEKKYAISEATSKLEIENEKQKNEYESKL